MVFATVWYYLVFVLCVGAASLFFFVLSFFVWGGFHQLSLRYTGDYQSFENMAGSPFWDDFHGTGNITLKEKEAIDRRQANANYVLLPLACVLLVAAVYTSCLVGTFAFDRLDLARPIFSAQQHLAELEDLAKEWPC